MSVYLSTCISTAPLVGFTWSLILDTFMEIFRENPNLVKIVQEYRELYTKTYVDFIVVADYIKSPQKRSLQVK